MFHRRPPGCLADWWTRLRRCPPYLLVTYGVHGQVEWLTGIPSAVGGLLAIGWGVKLPHALPPRLLGGAFSLFLLLCGSAPHCSASRAEVVEK